MSNSFELEKVYDVVVVGGGAAGIGAAVGAASSGARVLLVEASGRWGGAVVGAMHRSLCGLYSARPSLPVATLNAGVQRELVGAMLQSDPANARVKQLGRTWVLEIASASYEAGLAGMCDRMNVQRVMGARVNEVRREGNRVGAIQIGSHWVDVKSVVDCTGSGAVLQMMGEDVMLPADLNRMLGGYAVRLIGILGDGEMSRLRVPYALAMGVAAGALPHESRFAMFHPGPGVGEGVLKLAVKVDGVEIKSLASVVVEYLRDEVEGFEKAAVVEESTAVLPRDGRRLKGKSLVSGEDVLGGRQVGEESVHAWWPIEKWDATSGPSYAYPPEGRHYDVPDDALRSGLIENLYAAGTCVSATSDAAASIRASGICLATGERAGRLAAE